MKKGDKIDTTKQAKKSLNGSNLEPIKIPNYQKRADEASAFLKKNPPFEVIKTIDNERIKAYFVEGKNTAQIAVLMRMFEEDITLRLQEMRLIETKACV